MEHSKNKSKSTDTSKYLIVTIGFDCNNRCINCMLEGVKDKLKPVSFEEFKRILLTNQESPTFTSLILSGAEVTLKEDLIEYVQFAREFDFIENIRIQTNGRKLSSREYSQRLFQAGVNEYFVSVYGPDESIHNAMTQQENSFQETLAALKHLDQLGARVITNTVITRLNYQSLPSIVEVISTFPHIREMQFWNFIPSCEEDPDDLLVSNRELQGPLFQAFALGIKKGISTFVQGYPECLLGNYREHLDETRPPIIIDPQFWNYYGAKSLRYCQYQNECQTKQCWRLPANYINKFGWDLDIIHPLKNPNGN